MRILVTGGAGYLGSLLVSVLLDEGHTVTVIDNGMYLGDSLLNCCHHQNFLIISGDIRDQLLIRQVINKQEVIIPLAALVGQPLCEANRNVSIDVNVNAVSYMMKIRQPFQRIIFPSTQSCYGNVINGAICDEMSPLSPMSQYAKTKAAAEQLVMEYDNVIALRLGTLFGVSTRMRNELLINNLVYRAIYERCAVLENPQAKRNYIHIRDAVNTFVFCINNFESLKNNVYNVGNSSLNISKYEICEAIQSHFPEFAVFVRSDVDPIDKRNYTISMSKIESKGWHPKVSLSDGIIELVKAFNLISPIKYSNYNRIPQY